MEEQLISFETAKLAKDKGFFEGFRLYNTNGKIIHTHFIGEEERKLFSAVTQPLLQKWLRDIHNIRIDIADRSVLNSKIPEYHSFINSEKRIMFDWQINQKNVDRTNYELILENTLFNALLFLQ